MADDSYQPGVYREHGGDALVVKSSGSITVESSGTLKIGAVATATTSATMPANGLDIIVGGTTATGANVFTLAAPVVGQLKLLSCTTANSSDVARVKGTSTGITFGAGGAKPFLNFTEAGTALLIGNTTANWHVVLHTTGTPLQNVSS